MCFEPQNVVATVYANKQQRPRVVHLFQDLNKWKNRRRSTKSDLRRKSQDREHVINQMSNGAVAKFEKKEGQSGLLKRYAPATDVKENLQLSFPNLVATNDLFKMCNNTADLA